MRPRWTKRKRPRRPLELVSEAEMPPADQLVLVGGPENHFADNLSAPCDDCGATIYYRPTAPAAARRVCHACYVATYQAAAEKVIVTAEQLREVALFLAKTKGQQ